MECSICGHPIESKAGWDQGNNAEPIKEGRCCDWCNNNLVMALRLRMFKLWSPEHATRRHNNHK
jgi:hypothetical protein